MNDFPMSLATWQGGLTLEAYLGSMRTHQDSTRRQLAQIALRAEDRTVFARLNHVRHALVMTEDWCGDSMLNVPILAHIVQAVPGLDLRVFVRSASPELDRYDQSRGIARIPVFTFFDAEFRELATWVERPRAAHERLAAWYAARPEIAAVRSDPALDPDERRQKLRPLTAGLLAEMESWYDQGLWQATVDEIRQLLVPAPQEQP